MVHFRSRLALLVGVTAVGAPVQGSLPDPPPAHVITAIKAVLYHHETAQFDTTDVTGLWNPESGAILVLVKVTGTPFVFGTLGGVEVRVHVGPVQVYSQTVSLSKFFSEQRTIWLPFLVYDPGGCHSWKVTATLVSPSGAAESTLTKDIEFACGE